MNNRNQANQMSAAQRIQSQLAQLQNSDQPNNGQRPPASSLIDQPPQQTNQGNGTANSEVIRAHQAAARALNIDTLRQVQQETQQILAAVQAHTAQHQGSSTARQSQAQVQSTSQHQQQESNGRNSSLNNLQNGDTERQGNGSSAEASIPIMHYLNRMRNNRERENREQLADEGDEGTAGQGEQRQVDFQALLQNQNRFQILNAGNQTGRAAQNQRQADVDQEDLNQLISQTLGTEESKQEDFNRTARGRMNTNRQNNNSTNYTTGQSTTTQATQIAGVNDSGTDAEIGLNTAPSQLLQGSNPSTQWPPVDLYQQIDALIQQSNPQHNHNEGSRSGHNRLSAAQDDTITQSRTSVENNQQILQQILRQANQRQNPPRTTANTTSNAHLDDLISRSLSIQAQQQILDSIQLTANEGEQTGLNQAQRTEAGANRQSGQNNRRSNHIGGNRIRTVENNIGGRNRGLEASQNSHSTLDEEQKYNDYIDPQSSEDSSSNSIYSNSDVDLTTHGTAQNARNQIAPTTTDQIRRRDIQRQRDWNSIRQGAGQIETDEDGVEGADGSPQRHDEDAASSQLLSSSQANPGEPDSSLSSPQHNRYEQPLGARDPRQNIESLRSNPMGQANFGGSSDEEEVSNTSHEDNIDRGQRQLRETNLNLRALGIGGPQSAIAQINLNSRALNTGVRNMTSNANRVSGARVLDYPMQDEMDDNDDVVSMSESANNAVIGQSRPSQRFADLGTIQSANTRRVVEQNINANLGGTGRQGRQHREEQKTSANQNIEEIFKCFICYGKIQDAVLCPSCSKLCCRDCIKKWLTEQRQQCPHCRCGLQVHQLVNCRFIEEITAAIDTLNTPIPDSSRESHLTDGTVLRDGTEVCKEHGAKLDYYCQTCKVPICSECAMFGGDKHKDHKFLRLGEVYEKHCDVIKKEAIGLKKRLKELAKHTNDVQLSIEKVTRAKEDKCKEIENFVENIQAKLNTQLKNKLLTLLSQRQSMQDEIEQLEEFHGKLNQELTKMPKTSLIKKSGDLIRQLKEIHTKEPHRFVENDVSVDFNSELVPQYEQAIFVIKNFSRIRQNQNQISSDDNEIVYSDPPLVTKSGLSWRLKVYPNGNGIAKGNYISVFLEMLKGLADSQTQKYEYRVEMLNHRNPSAQVVREFASEFEVGECWGYNRFYRIDLLDREGYLNNDDDSITLKFFVRAPYYSQHCSDQERHITNLQKQIEDQHSEIELLKQKYADAQKKLSKKNSSSKPKKFRKSNQDASDSSLANDQEDESPEIGSRRQHDSHHFLKELKEKQKRTEQRNMADQLMAQEQAAKRSRESQGIASKDLRNTQQRDQEESKTAAHRSAQKKQELGSKHFSIQLIKGKKDKNLINRETENRPSDLLNFGTSDEEEKKSRSSSDEKQGFPVDFYTQNQQIIEKDDGSRSQREISPKSARCLSGLHKKFGAESKQKETGFFANKLQPNSDNNDENSQQIGQNSQEKKASQGSSNKSINNEASSQNEEEKQNDYQYQILKQSLKALQERANSTFQMKPEEGIRSDLLQNHSVSSDNSDNQIPVATFDQTSTNSQQLDVHNLFEKVHQETSSNNSGADVVDAIEQIMNLDGAQEESKQNSSVITDGRAAEQSYIQSSFDAKDDPSYFQDQEERKVGTNEQSSSLIDTMLQEQNDNTQPPCQSTGVEEEQKIAQKTKIPNLGSLAKKIQEKKMQTQQLLIKQQDLVKSTSGGNGSGSRSGSQNKF